MSRQEEGLAMAEKMQKVVNPYRPGAGHKPPYLAGRAVYAEYFCKLLQQSFYTENLLITGLRGMGKTVLLDSLREVAIDSGWLWIGNDLSESSTLSEDRIALRLLTDISHSLTRWVEKNCDVHDAWADGTYRFSALRTMYENTPGLPSDKLNAVLDRLNFVVRRTGIAGFVFAYDEAQCLRDHKHNHEYPMSMVIETISTLQRKDGGTPCLLVLSGLPQVHDALIETRTYTERMFHVISLGRLSREETMEAILNPLKHLIPPPQVTKELINKTADLTGGYPYLVQFFGKELVEALWANGGSLNSSGFPNSAVIERLDASLFASRWNKTSEKQRLFLGYIARRSPGTPDFSAQDILSAGAADEGFTRAQANQMMQALCERGLLYRSRHGRYRFTVPMSEMLIQRRQRADVELTDFWLADSFAIRPTRADALRAAPSIDRRRGWNWFR